MKKLVAIVTLGAAVIPATSQESKVTPLTLRVAEFVGQSGVIPHGDRQRMRDMCSSPDDKSVAKGCAGIVEIELRAYLRQFEETAPAAAKKRQ